MVINVKKIRILLFRWLSIKQEFAETKRMQTRGWGGGAERQLPGAHYEMNHQHSSANLKKTRHNSKEYQ